ncbi:hypothetical protein E2C01_003524 [Portunus trituberculatus]|uniref:Uncharacterized protein n=1 Tax=Portunus trituberculatus TaxID=210409 RepID=A0A5B7CN09_PORTR|nr:hypothetical protein [Portunus trituberculatus]
MQVKVSKHRDEAQVGGCFLPTGEGGGSRGIGGGGGGGDDGLRWCQGVMDAEGQWSGSPPAEHRYATQGGCNFHDEIMPK